MGDSADQSTRNFGYRSVIEWVLRILMIAAIAIAIWEAVHVLRDRPSARATGSPSALRAALARWSTVDAPGSAHVSFDSVPTPDIRDWIAALPSTGTRMTWEGATLRPAAVSVEPVVDPKRPARVWVAAPARSSLSIRDALGLVDSIALRSEGGVLSVRDLTGAVRASVGGTSASGLLRDSIVVKPVLVIGIASWEPKFIIASLEEHGWKTDAHIGLAPTGDVVQGPATVAIDTSRYSAVIALDTSAAKYAGAVAGFVRNGGGFIASGDAASLAAFAPLLPASVATALPEAPFEADSSRPRHALSLTPLVQLKSDAIAIESIDGRIAVAARRFGRGRVLQVGYVDTWRWRMGGFDDPVRKYSDWWSAMVSSVAYAPRSTLVTNVATDPTPLATLVGTLGVASPQPPVKASLANDPRLLVLLCAGILGALLLETGSRRLRGRP